MTWHGYLTFLAFAAVLVLVPGPDFAVVTRGTLAAGPRRGRWSSLGVTASNCVQGLAAALGLGALVVRSQPVFETVRWLGICYLLWLGLQAFRSARRGEYPPLDAGEGDLSRRDAVTGFRQGFLSNITNPKVLVFYLAVLPQFLGAGASVPVLAAFALSHALLSLLYLLSLVAALHKVRVVLSRRRVRRTLDAATGTALVGFGVRLATEHA